MQKVDPHSADAIGNAGDRGDDSADPAVDVDKEKSPAQPSEYEKQIASQKK